MTLTSPEELGMNAGQLDRIGEHLHRNYLAGGKIPGCLTLVARYGKVGYFNAQGLRDVERQTPMTEDTIFRIYSMSKPVTSVALMTLYERGLFSLNDPVHKFIPAWKNLRVRTAGGLPLFETTHCNRPMTVRDLFTHTSGLTYDFLRATNIDYAYRKLDIGNPKPDYTLRDMVEQLSQLPLEFSPGEAWNYSLAVDVLGYLIEVISGQPLAQFLEQTIFAPLGMLDTGFNIAPDKVPRLASCYERGPDKALLCNDDGQDSRFRDRVFYSGGGGLLSTAGDYLRFCQMLQNGGSLDGQRILGARTLDFMTRNHLPNNADLASLSTGGFSESALDGIGFGLGFATKINAVDNASPGSVGQYFWGGLASTLFWVDPVEELTVLFMTQLIPSSTFNFRGQLESLVYAALE